MKTLSLLLSAFAFSAAALQVFAYDLSTSDGKTYKDASITKITPIGLGFISNGKSGWLDFRDLSKQVQKDFNYDPKAASAFEQRLVNNKGFVPQNQAISKPAPAQQPATPPAPATPPQSPTSQADYVSQQPAPDLSDFPADAQPLDQPPAGATVVDYSSGVPANIDYTQFACGPAYCANSYVYWGGHYYPSYYWHHWWWNHNWVNHNGHYYPWNYYHHNGVWENGKYYPDNHGRLYDSQTWKNEDANREKYQNQYHEQHGVPHSNYGGTHYHSGGGGRR